MGEGAAGSVSRWEETRTLGDLIVPHFEEVAESQGFLRDVTDLVSNPDAWITGQIMEEFTEGELLRFTAPTWLIDPEHIGETMERFLDTGSAVYGLAGGSGGQGQPRPPHGRSGRVTPRAGQENQGDIKSLKKPMEGLRKVAEGLLAGGITVRSFPCGMDYPNYGFSGMLLGRSDCIDPERVALFSRFGMSASEWTVVASIARFPRKPSGEPPSLNVGELSTGPVINRNEVERAYIEMLALFEASGFSAGPVWPSIGITPLAVYRTVRGSFSEEA
jgi:hypothetical protein